MTETFDAGTLLRRGSRGDAVAELQRALAKAGFDPGSADGIFGARTESAVKDFQLAHGLAADGVAGPRTLAALRPGEAGGAGRGRTAGGEAVPEPVPGTDWAGLDGDDRMRYAMRRLVDHYGYPVSGAAGLVGNLWAESGVIPNRVEGSRPDTPMRARDFDGNTVDFSAEQVMNRAGSRGQGPARPGVGLAQWTSPGRRAGLYSHTYNGVELGADVIFDMDAQLDYLDHELRHSYRRVHGVLTAVDVTVDDAADEVLYNFEIPGAILDGGSKLPRSDERVQNVFQRRREHAQRALRAYEGNTP